MTGFGVFLLTGLLLVAAAVLLFTALIWRSARPHPSGVPELPGSGGRGNALSGADELPELEPCGECKTLGAFYRYQRAANDSVPRTALPP